MRGSRGWVLLVCGAISGVFGGAATPTAGGLKIYADQMDPADFTDMRYGYDRNAVCANGTTACTSDFKVCDDGLTVCSNNANCAGIGSGVCHANPCAPPNNVCGVMVDSLTAGAPPGQTIAQLACGPSVPPCTVTSWDFSHLNKTQFPDLIDTASTQTAINLQETPNANQCGFTEPGAALGREDVNFPDPPHTIKTLNALDREDGILTCDDGKICTTAADCAGIGGGACNPNVSIWLRGLARWEGINGGLGSGESRLCFSGGGRTAVPLWRFPDHDTQGFYMQLGDPRWRHTPFNCEQDIFAGGGGLYVKSCAGFEGTQAGEVLNEGAVKLPSGHQFKALVVRNVAEYCVYLTSACSNLFKVDDVRTVLYMWQVPHLGTVVRLQSDKTAANKTDFTHLAEIDVKVGLFPPLALQVEQVTCDSVRLSWNPGAITDNISGYRIYWDTESGGRCAIGGEDCTVDHPASGDCAARETCCAAVGDTCQSYGSDSISDPGQVTFNGATSATISGLDPGTTYYFTVTAMSAFKDPSTLATTTYESVKYPTRIPAVPVDLPIEVSATTPPGPSLEVHAVTGAKSGSNVQFCWDPVADPCAGSYQILGATSPKSAANFSVVVPDTGAVTCRTFNPSQTYFLVVGKGGVGTGPWGHFGQ